MKHLHINLGSGLAGLALAGLVLGLPPSAHAATQVYDIGLSGLINQTSDCSGALGHKYNGCGGLQPGMTWTDTLPGGSVVSSVQIDFNNGVQCDTNTVVNNLNGTAGTTWASTSECACIPSLKPKTVTIASPTYTPGGVQTWTNTSGFTSCIGFSPGGALPAGVYGRVTVTYTAGGGGGGGGGGSAQCVGDPCHDSIEDMLIANLDAKVSSRSTQTSVNALQTTANTINTNVLSRATQTSITTLQTTANTINTNVLSRSTQTSVNNLQTTANTINTNVTDIENIVTPNLNATVSSRATQTSVDNAITAIGAVEAKLDADLDASVSTRATQASVDLLTTAVEAIEAKADATAGSFAALEALVEMQAMEQALAKADPRPAKDKEYIVSYVLPAASGGKIEKIRAKVAEAMANAASAGYDQTASTLHLSSGDAHYAAGLWRAAFDDYQSAYKKSTEQLQ